MLSIEEQGYSIGFGSSKKLNNKKEEISITNEDLLKHPKNADPDSKDKKMISKKKAKLGPFAEMGLNEQIVAGITRKGFKVPTEIQRKTIPILLSNKDVVAMAKTGSGKTAAFLIPILNKLHTNPSSVGTRALILSPTRELAVQTLQFAKELGKFTGIKAATVLGGESWNDQFAAVLSKPDLIIATPGRFLHLCIEMNPNLNFVEFVVFDEADRLFDMGFNYQMKEIMSRLPSHRQTILFSATLPKILVEFAKAGLVEPELIRLDSDGKISDCLMQTFFQVNNEDKVALCAHLILEVIPTDQHTLIFAPTKHHCEYLSYVLDKFGIKNCYVYSSLDAELRKINVEKFRNREVNLMVATDVAARGIDIPFLDNVVNFNFPTTPKLYVHRVGRVARAGKTGVAYSLVAFDEIPHLIDIELFMNKKIRFSPKQVHEDENTNEAHLLFARVPMSVLNSNNGSIRNITEYSYELQLLAKSMDLSILKFKRTKEPPSSASIKRQKDELWGSELNYHPLLVKKSEQKQLENCEKILDVIKNFRPNKVTYDCKKTSKISREISLLYKDRVEQHSKQMQIKKEQAKKKNAEYEKAIKFKKSMENCSEDLINETFIKKKKERDDQKAFFIPYKPDDYHTEMGYSVGTKFENEAASLGFHVNKDAENERPENASKWDRKRKKYVGTQKNEMIKTESGQIIRKSYRTDRYFKWKASSEGRLFKKQNAEAENSKHSIKFTTLNRKRNGLDRQKVHPLLKGKQGKVVKNKILNEDQVKKVIKQKARKAQIMKQNRERNIKRRKEKKKGPKPTYKRTKKGL